MLPLEEEIAKLQRRAQEQDEKVKSLEKQKSQVLPRDFPMPTLGPNIGPFQFKNDQNLSKMLYIIPKFLVVHFGENFTKIGTKIAMLQMHESLYENVNENMFSFTFLCKFS